jgi:tyrosyl-tRNA synthetase
MEIEEKLKLVKEVGEEIINEDELKQLFETKTEIFAYDGFEPSGQIHIAQGLLRAININKLTKAGIKFKILVADYFAMLNNKLGGDIEKIRTTGEYAIEVWKACGLNEENVEFVWASNFYRENPEYWETVMKIAMNATVSRVLKCGQIMGREENISNPASQIMYPIMQAADIYHLGVDIAQLGLDQRKVNMLARDIFPKIGFKKPICIHHHMLLGLQAVDTDLTGVDRKIAMKMSKSKPDTAIFMTDSKEEIERKFKKAYSVDGVVEDNPVLEYFKFIIFEKYDKVLVERPEKFGGNLEYSSYEEMKNDFSSGKVKSIDLKMAASKYINELLDPVRRHFEENKKAKELFEKVKSYQITR